MKEKNYSWKAYSRLIDKQSAKEIPIIQRNIVNLWSIQSKIAMPEETKPGLFGQKHSSRNYEEAYYWGKNQFNSSFPASLVAYMSHKDMMPVYLKVDEQNNIQHSYITGSELFGIDPLSDDAYYNYEAGFVPYEQFYTGDREKIDLVMVNNSANELLRGLEVKLTALPDNSTKNNTEERYSCEIVMRPPTICFLACSICMNYKSEAQKIKLRNLLSGVPQIHHWEEIEEVASHYAEIEAAVLRVSSDMCQEQTPLMIQPIWKTTGPRMTLSDDCLDVFVWSNLAVIQMCCKEGRSVSHDVNRFQRTIVWIYLMLFDYVTYGHFDYMRIIKNHSYGNANDKAFALNGSRSHKFLTCEELTHPRIKKSEIKKIILGGGQNLLSPERRFDAVIVNSPDLFD